MLVKWLMKSPQLPCSNFKLYFKDMNDDHMDDLWRRKEGDPPGRFGAVRLSDGERRRQKTGGEGEILKESNREKKRERI